MRLSILSMKYSSILTQIIFSNVWSPLLVSAWFAFILESCEFLFNIYAQFQIDLNIDAMFPFLCFLSICPSMKIYSCCDWIRIIFRVIEAIKATDPRVRRSPYFYRFFHKIPDYPYRNAYQNNCLGLLWLN